MASSQNLWKYPPVVGLVTVAKCVFGLQGFSQSDPYAPLYIGLRERKQKYSKPSNQVLAYLEGSNTLPIELYWMKDETFAWCFKQHLKLDHMIARFLRENDIGSLFVDPSASEFGIPQNKPLSISSSELQSLCNSDDNGNMKMSAQYYLDNFYSLAELYRGKAWLRDRLHASSLSSKWSDFSAEALNVFTFLGENRLVQWLLNHVANPSKLVNHQSILLGPALFAAVHDHKSVDALNTLLSVPSINPNIKCRDGRTPLEVAVSIQNEFAFFRLLDHKSIDPHMGKQDPPLLLAAVQKEANGVVAALLHNNWFDVNFSNIHGDTTLSIAATLGNKEVFDLIFMRFEDTVELLKGKLGLPYFLFNVHVPEIMDRLLTGPHIQFINVQRHEDGHTILMEACGRGDAELVSVLCKHRPNHRLVDKTGWRAIDWAEIMGNPDILNSLQQLEAAYR